MSEENVTLARRIYRDGDVLQAPTEEIDRMFREDLDEDVEFHVPPDYPEGEVLFRGREGVDRLIATLGGVWREYRFEAERFLDAGDQVVVFARISGKGAGSGVAFERETTHVVTVRAGRATLVHVYRDRAEALAAVGLSDWRTPPERGS